MIQVITGSQYGARVVTVHAKIVNCCIVLSVTQPLGVDLLNLILSNLNLTMWSNRSLRVTRHESHPCLHY